MTELTEQLKLSRIPDAEIGQRIKAVVYFFVHVYCLAYVSGQTLKNIITTPQIELKKLWQELFHALKEWLQPLYSDALMTTKQQSNLQHNEKVYDCSQLIRSLLIRERIITASGSDTEETF